MNNVHPESTPSWRTWIAMAAVAAALLLGGCTSIPVEHLPQSDALALVDDPDAPSDPGYRIRAGDDLDIKFFYAHELNESIKVRPDGYITLQLVDDVKAAGLTPKELDDALTQRYAAFVKNPVLSVIVRSFAGFRAYVGGEVGVPQIVPLDGGVTPLQAIFRAGGVRPTGSMQSVVLIRKGPDGRPLPYRLDLSDDAVSQGRRDLRVALRPSDVLYVPRSPIANANRFVQQYIVDLLLFRGVQLGFNVDYIYNRDQNTPVVP
ncbi:MAG TPA: polysaccharide biosynthesis/export family protein [Albitalea sp.]|uniref:polysaccharide biosynthesis/export family protein n=1 Tax=Piscinibacter sp. TaxID=1903157 RepID=UPI002ED5E51B